MGEAEDEKNQSGRLFENFVQATDCKSTLQAFNIMCGYLELDPLEHSSFYSGLKSTVTCWKAKALWSKLDKRASHKEYKKGKACEGIKCLIIGGGPCGLRTAIELAFLGAKVVVIEKRDTFSRNNVLHLWPYTIHDLRALGAKKFYGKFCAGAIDHISIRQLQLMLLKIALLLGVEFHVNVEFIKLVEPPEDQENEGPGWRAEIRPADHPVADFDFDVVVGADGRRNSLEGFRRKEFRGKLAIAITANFINRNTTAEAKVEEISGVAFIFNQKFFQDLRQETGIDLENIVYYKDNTHYFVMTAKKQSLLDKGVIIHDYIDTEALLNSENVNQEALLAYAREAADYATHYQLPTLDYATNHCAQPDVAMFDFTSMYASESAALVRERFGHSVLVALVGDSLLEPFWPMGTGCARGFLAAFDTAWMVKSWAQGRNPLEVLAERESLYRLLPQTTPENIAKNFDLYTIDPGTRYPNLNSNCVRPHQVRNNYICGEMKPCSLERAATIRRPVNLARRESEIRPSRLLTWCQKQTEGYRAVDVTDLTSCWSSGLALCALIHRFRPQLIDYDSLNEQDCARNLQLAFDVAEKEFGIKPFITGKELAAGQEPDKTSMCNYLSKIYELFRGTPLPPSDSKRDGDANNEKYPSGSSRPVYKSLSLLQPRKRIPKNDKKTEDNDAIYKRRRKISYLEEPIRSINQSFPSSSEGRELKENKVKFMATQLLAKFEDSTASCSIRRQSDSNDERPPRPPSLDMTDSPLFNIIKKKVPPPPPPKKQFPSIACVQHSEEPSALLFPSLHSSPLNPRRKPLQPTHTHTHTQSEAENTADSDSGNPATCHSAVLAMRAMLQRLQRVEEEISQRKAQSQKAREFHKKSIKEKAVHLSSLFSGEACSPPQTDIPQTGQLDMQLCEEKRESVKSSKPHSSSLHFPHSIPLTTPSGPLPQCTAASCPPLISSYPSLLLQQVSKTKPLDAKHFIKEIQGDTVSSSHLLSSRRTSHFRHQSETQIPQSEENRNFNVPDKTSSSTIHPHQSNSITFHPIPKCTAPLHLSFPFCSASSLRSKLKPEILHCINVQEEAMCNSEMRTVGKVSLIAGARANSLVTLDENDHMPQASSSDSPPSLKREFPQSLGDVCHVCKKRVFVVERLSAEGFHFHRECFRCHTCRAPLRQGGHSFDSEEGKLYCKLHFAQRKPLVKNGGTPILHTTCNEESHDGSSWSPEGREHPLQDESPGILSSLKRSLRWPLHVSQTVCAVPRRVFNWLHGKVWATGVHLRDNVEDYTFLYELLSVSLPLLAVLHEQLVQMYAEAEPLNLQPLQHWLEEHMGHWVLV
ncbi:F-actin-monooxygenase MICAL2 isoform X1 [Carassius auratus]|uniref:F-actin monooxygenase n=2 Tax=Carassius auratus TaxID=7957 RepID=A0A6P6PT01_CARAU|nr:F-actin-monooxygenase MICAL2-like isoform X1 [Carassius auratus]XP_026124219.1 F-actin-monooxygenase MICAL2-like isoform X1 [Carassius auratus]XP_026124220.1 F-actin-monooxygenase MICAL2-like isoform X1 [Carassius auratus]